MAYHEKFKTTIKEIVDYYKNNLVNEEDIGVDLNEIHKRCWHCGDISKLCRCHIIPSSSQGQDSPDNFVLLCRRCHEIAPNCTDKQIMWDWLKFDSSNVYNLYWGKIIFEDYNKIYSTDFVKEYTSRHNINADLLQSIFYRNFNNIKMHIGSGHINSSTWVGLFKMTFNEFDKSVHKKYDKFK